MGEKTALKVPDLARLQAELTGPWSAARATVTTALRAISLPDTENMSTSQHRAATLAALQMVAKTGVQNLGFSVEYGGAADPGGSLTMLEVMAAADLSLMVKAGVQWGLFGGAIESLGTAVHHDQYLRKVMSAELMGCFAMTETGHGSDVQRIRTTATYDADTAEFVVHTPDEQARKDYIGNAAADGRLAVAFAQLVTGGQTHGPHAFLVPIRDDTGASMPGVTITDCGRKGGLNGVDNGRLVFDQVRIPRSSLLNRYGDVDADGTYSSPIKNPSARFFTMLGTLVRGRISVAGAAGSAAKKGLTIAIRYGSRRRQFAPAGTDRETLLLDYPAYQRTLLPALARSYGLHFAQNQLLGALQTVYAAHDLDGVGQRALESRAAGLKAIGTWHAADVLAVCREACGGAGYLAVNQLPQLKADLDVFTTFEGANTVLLQLAGKGLLTTYRDHVGDLDPRRLVGFVAEQLLDSLAEASGARSLRQRLRTLGSRGSDVDALRDPEWQLALFTDRAQHLLGTTARRMQQLSRTGGNDPAQVLNLVQDQLLRAARADVERDILAASTEAVTLAADDVRPLLAAVRDLAALAEIERDSAWFLQHGRLTVPQTKSAIKAVDQLCAELRPHAELLVAGFGIPDEWITAPIVTP